MTDRNDHDEPDAPSLPPETPRHEVVTPGENEVQQPDKHDRPAQE